MSVNMGTATGYLDLDTSKFKSGFKSALADLKVFKSETATSKDKLAAFGSAATSTGKSLTKGLTAPIVGVGAAAVAVTAKFDKGMSEVQAISGATGSELTQLRDKAKEMGAKTKFSATQSAEAFKYMAMAGWKTEDMLDGIEGVMNLAAASGEDLATTSDIVTDALTAFGLEAKDSSHFADVLAAASSNANTNVSMMGETFKYVAPVAGSLKFKVEDVSTAIGLMANSGIKGSQAGTALRNIFTRMAKPTKASAEAMDKLGVSMTDSHGNMKDLDTIMGDLRQGFSGLTEAEKAKYAADLAGQYGMSGLLAIVNTSEKDYNKLKDAIYNADGASQQMADTMMDNLPGALTLAKSALEGLGIRVGEVITPAVTKIVRVFTDFVAWLTNASDGTVKFVVAIGTMLAALGPLLLVFGTLASKTLALIELYGKLSSFLQSRTAPAFLATARAKLTDMAATIQDRIANSGFGVALSGLTQRAAAAASKILAMAAAHKVASLAALGAVGAIAGIAIYMAKSGTSAEEMKNKIVSGFQTFAQKAPEMINKMGQDINQALPQVVTTISQALPNLIQTIISTISTNTAPIINGIVTIMQAIVNAITTNMPMIIAAIIQLIIAIGNALIQNLPIIINAAIQIVLALISGLIQALPQLVSMALRLGVAIVTAIIRAVPKILRAGIKLIQNLGKGFTGKKPWLLNLLKKLALGIPKAILTVLGALLKAGVDLIKSVWKGIKSWWKNLKKNIGDKVKKIPEYFAAAVTGLFNKGMELVQGLWDGWKKKWAAFKKHLDENSKAIGKTFQKNYKTGSPSRWFRNMGTWLVQGLDIGWNKAFTPFLQNVGSQVQQVKDMYTSLGSADIEFGKVKGGFNSQDPVVSAVNELALQVSGQNKGNNLEDWKREVVNSVAEAIQGMQVTLDKREMGRFTRKAVKQI